jgi:transketolase
MQMLSTDLAQVERWRRRRAELVAASPARRRELLADVARQTRRSVVRMIRSAGQGHIGGDFSVTDILTTLFSYTLRVDPAAPSARGTDRFILSKGHCAASLYATLADAGYFPLRALETFMRPLSELNGHPNRTKVPGVETNTGPLGHGLPVAVGQAVGARLTGSDTRVFVVLGDGELQEGSNWEALMTAAHYRLDNLVLIVDRNRLQQGARTEDTNGLEPLEARLRAFGCEVRRVDGHDFDALIEAFGPATENGPVAVIADTVKGKGVSFMEDRVEWHHKVPTPDQAEQAMKELA